ARSHSKQYSELGALPTLRPATRHKKKESGLYPSAKSPLCSDPFHRIKWRRRSWKCDTHYQRNGHP
ncbi:unnamed protein product, partial [Gulo gulo]